MQTPFQELEPIKTGLITKEGGNFKTWKKRAFALEGKYLYYYLETTDVKPRGVIYIKDCVLKDERINDDNDERFCFSIEPQVSWNVSECKKYTKRKYYLVFSSFHEMNDWAAIINIMSKNTHVHTYNGDELFD